MGYNPKEQFQQATEQAVGKFGVVLGGSGLTVQVITEWTSLAAMAVNLLLGIGGLYLMGHKLLSKRRDRWKADKGK